MAERASMRQLLLGLLRCAKATEGTHIQCLRSCQFVKTVELETHLVAYLSLREALGFQMRAEKTLLPEFVAFVQAQGSIGPIRAEMALEWACQASAHRGPSGAARRLSLARGFLLYLQTSAP